MAESDEEKRRRRRRQQAMVPPPTTPSTTVPAPTYLPPTRTPAAPSGTPTTSTTVAPTTTTTAPAPTTTVPAAPAPKPETSTPAPAAPQTREQFNAEFAKLMTRINENERVFRSSAQFSAEYNKAVEDRKTLFKSYVDLLTNMIKTVGIIGADLKPNYKVPASLTKISKALSDPKTAEATVQAIAPQIGSKVAGVGNPNPLTNYWLVSGPKAGTGSKVDEQPTGPAAPTGPTAPGVPGGGVGRGGGKVTSAPKMNWDRVSAKFRELFPTQAWILDIDRAKYPDVEALLRRAVDPQSEMTAERFGAEYQNTSFYRELATTGKVRQIKQLIGDAGFDSVPFNAFVTKAMNLSWDGDTLKFEAYKEAFRKDDTGQFVNPTAVTRIKKSNDYLGIANIGKAYFNQVSDDTIQRTLTGEMTTEDVQRQQREVAKARYGHLAPLIDQGLTLDAISESFKTAAAQLLEVDPNTIDMSNAQYEVALNFGEEGKKRVMTNGEWQKLLRTDARYGWDKTENAKREAREWASALRQTFGRII